MKHLIASLVTLGTLMPAFWFHVIPHAEEFCASVPYSVQRPNSDGVMQTLTFRPDEQAELCKHIKDFPM